MIDNIEEFEKKIISELDIESLSEINHDKNFRNFTWWSSMNALIIIAFINTEYSKRFTSEDLKTCNSLRDVYELVQK
jgi:acyl carrier protein